MKPWMLVVVGWTALGCWMVAIAYSEHDALQQCHEMNTMYSKTTSLAQSLASAPRPELLLCEAKLEASEASVEFYRRVLQQCQEGR